MKIPLYDNNMNFVTTFDLHHTLADLLKTWGYVHVSLPKPIPSPFSFNYGDYLKPSLSVYQIRIRLEYMIRNSKKCPFYFVEADNEALEFLQNYDKKDSYQISDTNYQKWKTSQIEKYAKSSPDVSPTPSTTKTTMPKASKSVSESESASESISISNSPSIAPEEDDFFSASPSEAPHADEWKTKDDEILVFDGYEWKEVNKSKKKKVQGLKELKNEILGIIPLKVEKPKKPKKQSNKKKIGLPKEQLKRNIILE